ncbi:hypothetical protein ACS0TY_004095 [Phlomoides rotata]
MDVDDDGESHAAADNATTDKTSFSVDENNPAPVQNRKGNYLAGSKDTFGQIAETMGQIANHVGAEFDNRHRREQVYDRLSEIEFILVEARVAISQYLCNNTMDMDLFFSLLNDAKIVFVTNIMRNMSTL